MAQKVGFFEDVFEQGGQIVKQTAKQIVNAPAAGVKTAANQVAPGLTPPADSENSPDNKKQQQKPIAQQAGSVVKGFAKAAATQVAPITEDSPDLKKPLSQPKSMGDQIKQQVKAQNPEEISKEQTDLAQVRQELHHQYYQNLINRPKPKEEKAGERVERQEK